LILTRNLRLEPFFRPFKTPCGYYVLKKTFSTLQWSFCFCVVVGDTRFTYKF